MRITRALPLLLVAAGCAEPDDSRAESFEYIHAAIIEPSCATIGCHSAASFQGGQDFSAPDCDTVYGALELQFDNDTGTIPLLRGTGNLVLPDGEVYKQMPLDEPLAPADIRLVEAWFRFEDAKATPCE